MSLKRTMLLALLVCAIIGGGWTFWRVQTGVHVWRERTVVTLNTPDGPRTSEATREIRLVLNRRYAPRGSPAGFRVKGEAVSFDLGENGVLFVMAGNDEMNLFRAVSRETEDILDVRWRLWRPDLSMRVTEEDYPFLAYFPDPNDPKSVRQLTLTSLPLVLGRAFSFEEVRFERTYGAVTKGTVVAHLPWLEDQTLFDRDGWSALNAQNGFVDDAISGVVPGWLPGDDLEG